MSLNELWMLNVVVRVKNETSCERGSRADDVIVRALYEPSVATSHHTAPILYERKRQVAETRQRESRVSMVLGAICINIASPNSTEHKPLTSS